MGVTVPRRVALAVLVPAAVGVVTGAAVVYPALRASPSWAALATLACGQARRGNLVVATGEELRRALSCAAPGAKIVLKPGSYGTLELRGKSRIALTSENPRSPASFERLSIAGSDRIDLSFLRFAGAAGRGPHRLDIGNSRGIRVADVDFPGVPGRLDDTTDAAVFVRHSAHISLVRTKIAGVPNGIKFLDSADVVIADNVIHNFMSDGIQGARTSQLRITGNYITNARPAPGAHPDGIQIFVQGDAPSPSDIVIADNLIEKGEGGLMQGIFVTNGVDNPFRNVRIERNLVLGSLYHGITLMGCIGATISGNLVVPPAGRRNWIMVKDVSALTMKQNTAQDFLIEGKTVRSPARLADNQVDIASAARVRAAVDTWKTAHLRRERAR